MHQCARGQEALAIAGTAEVFRLSPVPGEYESPVVTALAIDPQGACLALAGDDHAIRLVDAAGGGISATISGHRDWVKSMAFSPSGRLLASCGHDGDVRVWEVAPSGRELRLLIERRAEHALFGVAFASDNELYAVGFSDAVYRLEIAEDRWQVDHRCDCADLRAIDITSDGRWMAYGGRDGVIRIRPLMRSEHVLASAGPPGDLMQSKASPSLHYERILAVRFADDGRSLYSCGEDCRLVQWDPASDRVMAAMDIRAGKLQAVCPLHNGLVAVSGSDNTIRVVDASRGTVVAKLVGHDGSVAALRRNGTHLFSSGFDTTVRTWDLAQAIERLDDSGRFVHPISAQFEDSSAQERIR